MTSAEIQAVTTDLKAIAAVATKPSTSSVATLKAEIGTVVSRGSISLAQAIAIRDDATAVLVSAHVPTSLAQQTLTDVETVAGSGHITRAQLKVVLNDVKQILTNLGSARK